MPDTFIPGILHTPRRARAILVLPVASVAVFLLLVGRHYSPSFGFTSLIVFSEAGHAAELPAVQRVPHYHYEGDTSYDGQYYAQLAVEPLLRDPAIDRAMDFAQYRARRILFSWTAYILGLGRPAWILEAYALQNVLCWLLLAWWLARRHPPTTPRTFAIWIGCLFAHGLLVSVRRALLDGPGLLLVAVAVHAYERRHRFTAAGVLGMAALGRETCILGAAVFLRDPRGERLRPWRVLGCIALLALPTLLWFDYLRSIYRSTALGYGGQLATPFVTFANQWVDALILVSRIGTEFFARHYQALICLVSLTAQAAFLLVRRRWTEPWWRVGVAYVALMLLIAPEVWQGEPGAATRVLLPMTWAFNLLLVGDRAFWPWWVAGNLSVVLGLKALW